MDRWMMDSWMMGVVGCGLWDGWMMGLEMGDVERG